MTGDKNFTELPKGWICVRLDEVSVINPKLNADDIKDDLMVTFLPMKCVKELTGVIDLSLSEKLKKVKKGYTPFINGDLLFAKITPCMENGKVAIAHNLQNGIGFGSTEFHIIRLHEELPRQFFFNYLIREDLRKDAQRNMTGSAGQLRVPVNYMKQLRIPLPPLPEQHRIVSKLEELFTRLDAGVEALRKVKAELKRYRQAVLKYAFEGKLTEEWREKHKDELEPASVLLERIKEERKLLFRQLLAKWEAIDKNDSLSKLRKPEFYSSLTEQEMSDLPSLPPNWKWEKIGNICQSVVPNRDKPKSFSGDIPWLTTPYLDSEKISVMWNLVKQGLNKFEIDKYNARLIPSNSVIMTCVGTFGVACVNDRPCVINQQLHAFITHPLVNPKYLAYALKYQKSYMEKKATSTTVSYLNKTNCNTIPVPFCPLDEQYKIVETIETVFSVADALEQIIEQSFKQSERFRQSALKQAFEGKLVPQDPSDEPAEKLLERIKEEKSKCNSETKGKGNNSDKKQKEQLRLI